MHIYCKNIILPLIIFTEKNVRVSSSQSELHLEQTNHFINVCYSSTSFCHFLSCPIDWSGIRVLGYIISGRFDDHFDVTIDKLSI